MRPAAFIAAVRQPVSLEDRPNITPSNLLTGTPYWPIDMMPLHSDFA
jgi:hypothetical protein